MNDTTATRSERELIPLSICVLTVSDTRTDDGETGSRTGFGHPCIPKQASCGEEATPDPTHPLDTGRLAASACTFLVANTPYVDYM